MINQGLSLMIKAVAKVSVLDTGLLELEEGCLADKLVRWGLDINAIANPTDKALTTALERDLGL